MEIMFYPYDFEYKIKDNVSYVYLYSKLEDHTKICIVQPFQPYFYAFINDIDKKEFKKKLNNLELETKNEPARVIKWEIVKKELLGKLTKFWKIYVNYPKAVPIISKHLEACEVQCYEKDILFIHRYLRDQNITPMSLVKANGKFDENIENNLRVPIFLADSIKQESKEAMTNVRILAFDIETYNKDKIINPEINPILMIALYGVDENNKYFKKVLTWKKFKHRLSYLEFVNDEIELINRFREILLDYKPEIITGYFSDGFDFPYLKVRADKYKIKLDLGIDCSEIGTSTKAKFRESKTNIKGILHLDMFKFIRYIFGQSLKTDSYSLDAVSKELLKNKKHQVNIENLAQAWDKNNNQLVEFCEYNLHDAYLTLMLCQKLLPDMIEFTKLLGLPLFDITRMRFSRLVENYILKRAIEHNVLAPNKPNNFDIGQRSEETYSGGFVYEPTPGIYKNIIVFDFRSLYPTIITAHNIGPESLNCKCCNEKEKAQVPKKDYWFCTNNKKFIPSILERIILRRISLKRLIKETKKKGKDTAILEARSYALKTLANSFYGYLGFFGARWYCLECVKSITAFARNYIKETITKAEKKGFKVVYGDTDSCFLLLGNKIKDQAMELMNEVNFNLPGHMELEFEGLFPRGIFVAAKGSNKGAKKKYALISEDGSMKITGFETVRRNWSLLAKEVQEKVLKLVLNDKVEEALNHVKTKVKELKEGKIPINKLIIKTQITKELSAYSSIGPHVAVAMKMLEKGLPVNPGTVVQYVITKGVGLIRERAKLVSDVNSGEYDAKYYLNNQLIPAVISIFAVLGYSEQDLVSKSNQEGLSKFF